MHRKPSLMTSWRSRKLLRISLMLSDLILGNAEKLDGSAWLKAHAALSVDDAPKAIVNDIMAVKETAAHLVDAFRSDFGQCREARRVGVVEGACRVERRRCTESHR